MKPSTDQQELLPRVAAIVEQLSGVPAAEVTPDKTFAGDLELDSLCIVEIAFAVQEEIGVDIPEDDLARMSTVGHLVDFAARATGER
ncbi:acyl carrier protein [Nonomuraea sp. NN258]|uniref:acyl carrier protein n=1 Tax=Nonomuraea antri TaxID=2730852 RepID=UPI001568B519|nr:acyl carrier protein [Nonomuraea antri]NRQ31652.1 acyl carrier protein [Nonomuraea antri]